MVDIIPKSPQSSPLFQKVLFVVSLGVFAVALGGLVALLFLESRAQSSLEEAQVLLRAEKTKEQAQLEQDVFASRTRLQDFATLVQFRKDVLPAFSFLETVVHPDVTFLAMHVDAESQSLRLHGKAASFLVLGEQVVVLQAREEPSGLSLTSLQLGEDGGVEFQMEIQFPLSFFQ